MVLMSKFSKQHYNAIAKDIREEFASCLSEYSNPTPYNKLSKLRRLYCTDALVKLALRFARRFQEDNEYFDPLKFLDACSPDTDLYPLSELWEYDANC